MYKRNFNDTMSTSAVDTNTISLEKLGNALASGEGAASMRILATMNAKEREVYDRIVAAQNMGEDLSMKTFTRVMSDPKARRTSSWYDALGLVAPKFVTDVTTGLESGIIKRSDPKARIPYRESKLTLDGISRIYNNAKDNELFNALRARYFSDGATDIKLAGTAAPAMLQGNVAELGGLKRAMMQGNVAEPTFQAKKRRVAGNLTDYVIPTLNDAPGAITVTEEVAKQRCWKIIEMSIGSRLAATFIDLIWSANYSLAGRVRTSCRVAEATFPPRYNLPSELGMRVISGLMSPATIVDIVTGDSVGRWNFRDIHGVEEGDSLDKIFARAETLCRGVLEENESQWSDEMLSWVPRQLKSRQWWMEERSRGKTKYYIGSETERAVGADLYRAHVVPTTRPNVFTIVDIPTVMADRKISDPQALNIIAPAVARDTARYILETFGMIRDETYIETQLNETLFCREKYLSSRDIAALLGGDIDSIVTRPETGTDYEQRSNFSSGHGRGSAFIPRINAKSKIDTLGFNVGASTVQAPIPQASIVDNAVESVAAVAAANVAGDRYEGIPENLHPTERRRKATNVLAPAVSAGEELKSLLYGNQQDTQSAGAEYAKDITAATVQRAIQTAPESTWFNAFNITLPKYLSNESIAAESSLKMKNLERLGTHMAGEGSVYEKIAQYLKGRVKFLLDEDEEARRKYNRSGRDAGRESVAYIGQASRGNVEPRIKYDPSDEDVYGRVRVNPEGIFENILKEYESNREYLNKILNSSTASPQSIDMAREQLAEIDSSVRKHIAAALATLAEDMTRVSSRSVAVIVLRNGKFAEGYPNQPTVDQVIEAVKPQYRSMFTVFKMISGDVEIVVKADFDTSPTFAPPGSVAAAQQEESRSTQALEAKLQAPQRKVVRNSPPKPAQNATPFSKLFRQMRR